jgi:predicted XRE-type DNA-binding protein
MKKQKIIEEEIADTSFEIGTGSVYEDLGFKNYKEMETKSNLVIEISKIIKKKKITQTQTAEILSISQPKLSELLSGQFRGYSVERLIHFLNELGQDVDIVVRAKPRSRSKACVNVYHSTSRNRSSISMVAKGA